MSWASNPTTEMPPAPGRRLGPRLFLALGAVVLMAVGAAVVVTAPQLLGLAASDQPAQPAVATPSDSSQAATPPIVMPDTDAGKQTEIGASTITPRPSVPAVEEAMEELILGGTNEARQKAGCTVLRLDPKLRAAARRQALDMATQGFQSHTGSDGSEPADRMKEAGYDVGAGWAENVARGYPNVTAVMSGWLQSPQHKAEILRCTWKSVGVGVVRAGTGELFYAQEFGGTLSTMHDADDVLVLTVPDSVRAVYLVPTSTPPRDPAGLLRRHLPGRFAGDLGAMLDEMLERGVAPVEVRGADDVPDLPLELLAVMGASEEQLDRVTTATHFVLVTIQSEPGWPPMHEWMARAIATVLADRLGSDVVDVLNYHVLEPVRAIATLPDAAGRIRLADWVWIDYSADSTGYWCTTTGLRRFGLPELQSLATPPHVVEAWGQAMTGIAHRLLGLWSGALADDRSMAFAQLESTVEVSSRDIAAAYGHDDAPVGAPEDPVTVRLVLDPASDPEDHSFLTIHPPLSWPGSAGEHVAEVCSALFGSRATSVRRAGPSAEMDHAIELARDGLDDIRSRYESGALGLRQHLLVKYALDSTEGTEYVWAYVTSWRDPERLLAASAADAIYEPKVRAGRPVVVAASSIVDWAVEDDELGIVEGAWTQAALDDL